MVDDEDDFESDSQSLEDDDDLDLDYYMFKKNEHNFEAKVGESLDSHIQTPNPLPRMVEGSVSCVKKNYQ